MRAILFAAAAIVTATPALAQDDPRFCPNRPSLGASGCVTAPGEVQVEWSAFDWETERSGGGRRDTMLTADTNVRIGVGPSTEVQVGWTALGRSRTRVAGGGVDTVRGTGDVRLAVRQAFGPPDAQGWSLAVEPYVIAPVGKSPIGAGAWDYGVMLPVTYDLGARWQVAFTGVLDAKPNSARLGRHLDSSGTVGLGYQLSEKITLVGEVAAERDEDPDGASTQVVGAGSIAWQPTKRFQLDLLAVAGLNRAAPDFRIATGGAILF